MSDYERYLFRGKEKDSGKWIYGDLRHISDGHGGYILCIVDNTNGRNNDVTGVEVLPETVGQYTGLTDKNGVRIFEGDILDVSSDVAYGGVAVHRLGYFVVEFHNGCFMKSALDDPQLSFFDNAKRKGLYHFISTDIHKIVGNIHDNPELLKGGEDNG